MGFNIKKQIIVINLILIVFAGAFLNIGAVLKNEGKMPVYTGYYYETDTHIGFSDPSQVNVFFATDIFKIGDR
jgi:hypothetical protein